MDIKEIARTLEERPELKEFMNEAQTLTNVQKRELAEMVRNLSDNISVKPSTMKNYKMSKEEWGH